MFNIALIGRPNVGKSTLFNFLVGKKIALTDPTPGLTRDRKISKGSLYDINFHITDTGGYDDIGVELNKKIWDQSLKSIEDSNCVLFMLDGKAGLSPVDLSIADLLRKSNKEVIVCINKIDTKDARESLLSFYELGFDRVVGISAVHGTGLVDLHDLIEPVYHNYLASDDGKNENNPKQDLTIAFIGKPNVGKSTIINTLLNEDRLITNDEAGTTRDSIYIDTIYKGNIIKIMDTAGLRRRSKVSHKLERLANSDTISSLNFATIAVLVISAEEGITKQDLTLAKHVVDEGRGLIIVVNKIDLIKNKKLFLEDVAYQIEKAFYQIKDPYVLAISALKDKTITDIFDSALELYEKWQFQISTSKLNNWLQETISNNATPSVKHRKVKVKYISQAKSRPPTLNIWSNFNSKDFPDFYLRYLLNEFFKAFDLWGCTVRLNVKKSDNPYEDKKR